MRPSWGVPRGSCGLSPWQSPPEPTLPAGTARSRFPLGSWHRVRTGGAGCRREKQVNPGSGTPALQAGAARLQAAQPSVPRGCPICCPLDILHRCPDAGAPGTLGHRALPRDAAGLDCLSGVCLTLSTALRASPGALAYRGWAERAGACEDREIRGRQGRSKPGAEQPRARGQRSHRAQLLAGREDARAAFLQRLPRAARAGRERFAGKFGLWGERFGRAESSPARAL